MIKEKNKKPRYYKSKSQILMEYFRTVAISFSAAFIFTVLLSIHARSEMIKNLYVNIEERQKLDEQLARQLVAQSDLTKDLINKKYSICLQVGNLYETAQDYANAQFAYELAVKKVRAGVYTPYARLVGVLIAQEKFDEARDVLKSVIDVQNKKLIKFKTRSYIEMGDKYYSIGKFLSAAKSYEKAEFYYNRFSRKDKEIENSIITRIVNAYIETANVMVKSGYNTDAVRFLKKAEKYRPDDFEISYKLAIIYSDLEPELSVKYFEKLIDVAPQNIDHGVYSKALMKAANIADLDGRKTQAKYYRYKIHSVDLFVNNKVVYRNDLEVILDSFSVKKWLFRYRLKAKYRFKNVSGQNLKNVAADFVLRNGDRIVETISKKIVTKDFPLYSNGGETPEIQVLFDKNIFTKKELEQYLIDIYLYKDEKYKTKVCTMNVPLESQ